MPNATRSESASGEVLQQPSIQGALVLLFGGYRCAEILQRSSWEFSCDVLRLRGLGVTDEVLSELIAKGYVLHQPESLEPKGRWHQRQRKVPATWPSESCFVLSSAGATVALQLAREGGSTSTDGQPTRPGRETPQKDETPEWEPARRELRYLNFRRFSERLNS